MNKSKIEEFANNVLEKYACKFPIDLEELAEAEFLKIEQLAFVYDLDGLLVYRKGRFKIFINSNVFHGKSYTRKRFTLAHELGHYFIDNHRNRIINEGAFHSKTEYHSDDIMEREADYFASCLLMPRSEFKKQCYKSFSPQLIEELAEYFQVSISAALFRYIELDIYPLCMYKIKDGEILWFKKSNDFPFFVKNLRNMPIPDETMAYFIYNDNDFYEEPEEIDIYAWCDYKIKREDEENDDIDIKLYEYCFNHGDGVLTNIIWEV